MARVCIALRSRAVMRMLLVSHESSPNVARARVALEPGTRASSRASGSTPGANGITQMNSSARPPGRGRGSLR